MSFWALNPRLQSFDAVWFTVMKMTHQCPGRSSHIMTSASNCQGYSRLFSALEYSVIALVVGVPALIWHNFNFICIMHVCVCVCVCILSKYVWIYIRQRTIWTVCPFSPKLIPLKKQWHPFAGSPHCAVLGTSCLGWMLSVSWAPGTPRPLGGGKEKGISAGSGKPTSITLFLNPRPVCSSAMLCPLLTQWCLKLILEKRRPTCLGNWKLLCIPYIWPAL